MMMRVVSLLGCAGLCLANSAPMIPATMRAFVAHNYTTDFDSIKVEKIAVPSPGPGQVLIQAVGSSVNPVDYKIIESAWDNLTFPKVLGFDLTGVVVAVGSGCTRLSVGDKVWTDMGFDMQAYAEYVVAAETIVGLAPETLSLSDSATIPLVALTGYEALSTFGGAPWPASANKTVVISAGQGGTGIAAIQLAKAWGAATIITAASTENLALMKELGADVVVDFTKDDIWDVIADNSVDIVFENIGIPDTADLALAKIKSGGLFAYITGDAPTWTKPGVRVESYLCDSSSYKFLDAIKEVVDAGKFKPVVHNTYTLTDLSKAFIDEAAGGNIGKRKIDLTM